jgi:AcrR family transcriptional regulator
VIDASTDDRALTLEAEEAEPIGRVAKKERTRNLLIEAASAVIAERGFHEASLLEIASRAGLTTGAVYSNFRNKEDLFLAVIRQSAVRFDFGTGTNAPWEQLGQIALMAARGVDLPESRRLLKLQLEFALLALGDSRLMHELASDLREDRDELAGFLNGADTAPVPPFRPSSRQLAGALIATVQGLQQHRFIDREAVPEELVRWAVEALMHMATIERT